MSNRAKIVDENFKNRVQHGDFPEPRTHISPADAGLSASDCIDIFESQVMSRHLDLQARVLRARDQGFYTIGSCGHEGNAAVAKAVRPDDIAFLHYRSGAFLVQRSKDVPGGTVLYDMLLSFAGSADDPISGGRHKVLGSKRLFIPPQTSTIASHLPKAMGTAFAIPRAKDLVTSEFDWAELPHDSIAICSFGDASANHSTALGAFNTTEWMAYQQVPLPIIFVCEDNGIGISVRTPRSWIADAFSNRPALKYFECDGLNFLDTFACTRQAQTYARSLKKPVFLRMKTVRLLGHAGSDVEETYRSSQEIEETEAQDPLLHSARILIENEFLSAADILSLYEGTRERIARVAEVAITRPKLKSSKEIMEPIVPEKAVTRVSPPPPSEDQRQKMFSSEAAQMKNKQHLARLINWALADAMLRYPNTVLFGEDVAGKGGVYNVTTGLQQKFGRRRVFDSLLDEQSILGTAIGLAHNGFVPIPEIQFIAYIHNAEDQIRGEASTLSFFSKSQYTNPMVVRIAGLAYQKGFGGHFHNDNSLTIFRDIPGLIVAVPSNGRDAALMLKACVKAAHEERRVVIFVEPIALYMTRDLHEKGDGDWTFAYPEPSEEIKVGEIAVHGSGKQLCILTYGNGYYLSRQAAKVLENEHKVKLKVIDLRWIAPIDEAALVKELTGCAHVLVVEECRVTGSISEQLVTLMTEKMIMTDLAPKLKIARVAADDSFIPLGTASTLTLPGKESIVKGALELLGLAKGGKR